MNAKLPLALVATAILCTLASCGRPTDAAEPALPEVIELGAQQDIASVRWVHVGEQTSLTIWIGPSTRLPGGTVWRFVSLVASLPGSPHPLSCLDTVVESDGTKVVEKIEPVGLFSVRVTPGPGLDWSMVSEPSHLEVTHEGFH